MSCLKRYLPLVFSAAVLVSSAGCYAEVRYPVRTVGDRDDRIYYNRGFSEGRENGIDDARRGRSFDVRRHREYRDNRRGDDPGDLRAYRSGFEAGYEEGYQQARRPVYGEGRPPAPPPPPPPPPRAVERERIVSPARDVGFRDGREAGEDAARDRRRADPVREKRYREGDHEYDRRFGSLDDYKREYREGFREGYEAGYRRR